MAKPDDTFPQPLTGRGPDAGKPAEAPPKPAASADERDARKNARKSAKVATAMKRSTRIK